MNLVLTTSNANPLVDSSVIVTATVTQNGQPVPNGTAVEFSASGGVLNGTGTSTIKTTTDGVATVTLTSNATGPVRVFATVNNVTRQTDVNFVARPMTPPPPNTAPTITSVSPTIGRPQGGEVIRITGTNFRAPVRVLFNTGGATAVEASVQAVSETQIEVVTPPVNLGAGQQLIADVIVLTQAGTATEQRVEAADAFTYRNERLQPNISTVTPNSGPVTGGTRVTIFGDGFQEPVQVLFNTAEARVLNVAFDRINVETPAGRDTNPDGSGAVTGPVTVTVRNINSQTTTSMADGFHYKAALQITAVTPAEGPFTGGTRVDIEGIGFLAPVVVSLGDVAVSPVFVSGTKITVVTPAADIEGCNDLSGPVTVTNVNNGDQAQGPNFTFRAIDPVIVGLGGSLAPGGSISVQVANAVGTPRLQLGDTTLLITNTSFDATSGITTFTATIPTTIDLDEEDCPSVPGAAREVPTAFNITYTSLTTGCTDTLTNGAVLSPLANTPRLTVVPASFSQFVADFTPDDPSTPLVNEFSLTPSAPQTVTVTNTGTGTLTINSVTTSGTCGNFSISNPDLTIPLALSTCDPFPITAIYQGRTPPPSVEQCVVQINTSAGTRNLTLTGVVQ